MMLENITHLIQHIKANPLNYTLGVGATAIGAHAIDKIALHHQSLQGIHRERGDKLSSDNSVSPMTQNIKANLKYSAMAAEEKLRRIADDIGYRKSN